MNRATLLLACCGLIGCTGRVVEPGDDPDFDGPITEDVDSPERHPLGPADHDDTRRVRRLTADQFHRSLETATGQPWADYEEYANALGRPDLAEVTEEGRELSVTFEKLVNDGARASCRAAIVSDRTAETNARAILRAATLADRDLGPLAENLRYLQLRFLSVEITSDDDPRLTPWLSLLMAPNADGSDMTDTDMEYRWQAVCVGLATHPDFLSY